MTTASINGQRVEVDIIEPDGRSGNALEPSELDFITAIDAELRDHPGFAKCYPSARLTRVESNRILQDTDEGRFYFRYRHDRGDAEFWGHHAKTHNIDLERGIVTV